MKSNTLTLPTGVYLTVDNTSNWVPSAIWTVEFWCALAVNTGTTIINAMPWFSIFFDGNSANKLTVRLGPHLNNGPVQNLNTGYAPAVGDWHHYAITRDSLGNVDVYVDGVILNGGPTITQNPVGTSPSTLLIGSNGTYVGHLSLGDVRLWNYARSAMDISGSRNNWLDGMDTGLLAEYQFLENNTTLTATGDQAWWPAPKPAQHNATFVGTGFTYSINVCPVSIAPKLDPETPPVTARLDYGQQAAPYHLPMMLENSLKVFGLNADLFDESVFNNDYQQIYPEHEISQVPIQSMKVLMSQPFGGILTSDYISITQNITKEFKLVSKYPIKEQQVLRIWHPDQRSVHVRIVSCLALHPLSALAYVYEAVFV